MRFRLSESCTEEVYRLLLRNGKIVVLRFGGGTHSSFLFQIKNMASPSDITSSQKRREEKRRETMVSFYSPYRRDWFLHLRRCETDADISVNPSYMQHGENCRAHGLNWRMRSLLVDWMVDVHRSEKLFPETLFLGVDLLDRFLQEGSVERTQLQLVGAACLLIASKTYDIYPPRIDELEHMSDGAFKAADVIEMEVSVLSTLRWRVLSPTVFDFLTHSLVWMLEANIEMDIGTEADVEHPLHTQDDKDKDNDKDDTYHRISCLAFYVSELSLLDEVVLKYTPSQRALAALYVATAHSTSTNFVEFCGWQPTFNRPGTDEEISDILSCANCMLVLLKDPQMNTLDLKAISKKHASEVFGHASEVSPLEHLPEGCII